MRRLQAALFALLILSLVGVFAATDDIVRLYNFTPSTKIQSAQVNAEFNQIISTLNNKFGRDVNNTVSGNNTFSGLPTFSHASGLLTNTITERTLDVGVTADSVRLKDGMAKVSGTPTEAGEIGYASSALSYHNGTAVVTLKGLPPGHLDGLQLSNNSTDANNDIDVTVGSTRDDSDAADILLVSAMTKRLDAAWAEGTDEGGLDTGSKANSTFYHVFAIKNPTTGAVDVLLSTNRASPTMPTDYTLKRRIGAIRTNSSGNITAEMRSGLGRRRYVAYQTPSLDIISAASTTRVNATVSVPDGDRYTIRAIANNTGGGNTVYFSNPELTDLAAIAISTAITAGTNIHGQLVDVGGVSETDNGTPLEVTTNLNRQISFRCAVTGTTVRFITLGYWEEL